MKIAPPPIRTVLTSSDNTLIREWQKWFIDLVKIIQETQVLIYKQNSEPTIPDGYNFSLWHNTSDDKCYFLYRRGQSDQVKCELN
jgi:hypothetical protein